MGSAEKCVHAFERGQGGRFVSMPGMRPRALDQPPHPRAKPPLTVPSKRGLKPPGILGVPVSGPWAGLSPLISDPRPIILRGNRPLSSRNPWRGGQLSPDGQLYRSLPPPPPPPATRATVENPKSISGDGFLHHLPLQTVYNSTGLQRPGQIFNPQPSW